MADSYFSTKPGFDWPAGLGVNAFLRSMTSMDDSATTVALLIQSSRAKKHLSVCTMCYSVIPRSISITTYACWARQGFSFKFFFSRRKLRGGRTETHTISYIYSVMKDPEWCGHKCLCVRVCSFFSDTDSLVKKNDLCSIWDCPDGYAAVPHTPTKPHP